MSWEDPAVTLQHALELSDADLLDALTNRSLAMPPIACLLGFNTTYVERGRSVLTLKPAEHHYANSGELTAEGATSHVGRTAGTAQATLRDAAGKLCAEATSTAVNHHHDF